jgi:4-hydroxy-4-methyl-2-oxoglutarate aldolase
MEGRAGGSNVPRPDALVALGAATLGESGGRPLRPGLAPVWPGARVAGPARPVRCAAGDNLEVHLAVAAARGGEVLVVTVDGDPERGWWGEVLTVAAVARGVAGLVIDACVRDTAAIAARGFPVWSAGIALPGATKVTRGQADAPIDVRGTTVAPGDWVVADGDGVVVLDGDRLDEVEAAGRSRAEREAQMFDALLAGHTTVELLGLDGD